MSLEPYIIHLRDQELYQGRISSKIGELQWWVEVGRNHVPLIGLHVHWDGSTSTLKGKPRMIFQQNIIFSHV